jgi:hypothetical protein
VATGREGHKQINAAVLVDVHPVKIPPSDVFQRLQTNEFTLNNTPEP